MQTVRYAKIKKFLCDTWNSSQPHFVSSCGSTWQVMFCFCEKAFGFEVFVIPACLLFMFVIHVAKTVLENVALLRFALVRIVFALIKNAIVPTNTSFVKLVCSTLCQTFLLFYGA